jgi:hypothetical protein
MEWINADSLSINSNKKLTLNQVEKKEVELAGLEINSIPPILVNDGNEIIDGVKRYLVLLKNGVETIPIQRIKKTGKVNVCFGEFYNPLKLVA